MSYFNLLFFYYFYYNVKSGSVQVAEILPKGNENITKLYNEFQMQTTYFKIDLGCMRIQSWEDAGFQLHLYKMKPKAKAARCVSRHTVHKFSDP